MLKKYNNIAMVIKNIRMLSFYAFVIIFLLVVKETYVRQTEKASLLEKSDKQIVDLLFQYESAIRLSESLDKSHNIKFINKLMSFKEEFPKIISIHNINDSDNFGELGSVERAKNSINLLVGEDNKLFYVVVSYEEFLLYVLSKIEADNWFSIKVKSNIDGYQIKYNGTSFFAYLLDLIFDHDVTLILFCSAIILFGISHVLKKFFTDVTGTIELQTTKLKVSEENEKQLVSNVNSLQAYQEISSKMLYLLFNRAILNDVNSLDEEESVNLFSLIKEIMSFLAPFYSNKNITINIRETTNLFVKTSSREILLIIILNYVYRSIVRSLKNGEIKITLTHEEKEGIILKIIDKGYFYIESAAEETSNIFCLPLELLILLSKKLEIEVEDSKTQYNITSIIINTEPAEELGKNNVITLKK